MKSQLAFTLYDPNDEIRPFKVRDENRFGAGDGWVCYSDIRERVDEFIESLELDHFTTNVKNTIPITDKDVLRDLIKTIEV